MAESVVYRPHFWIERAKSRLRRAYLPAEPEPDLVGFHFGVAKHHSATREPCELYTTTLDYAVASTAG